MLKHANRDLEGAGDLFEAWVDAVGRRDTAAIAGLHVADGVFQLPRSAGARGCDEIRQRCFDWRCRDSREARFALGETRLFGTADIATCNVSDAFLSSLANLAR